jgi:hypothetical protein
MAEPYRNTRPYYTSQIIEPYPTSTIWGLFYAGYAGFDWFRGAFGETGDVLEFRLQLSRSFGSAILSRQYGMHCLGIRTRDVVIISTKKRRRADYDAVTWGLGGRHRSRVCLEHGWQAVERSSCGQLSTYAGRL